jgi:hypothetical protein
LRDHPEQTTDERLEFVRGIILKDMKVRNAGREKWLEVQKNHPGTRYEEFKSWEESVWMKWLSEKVKAVKRKQKRKRVREAAHEQSDVAQREQTPTATSIETSTPPSLRASSLSTRTPRLRSPSLPLDEMDTEMEGDFPSSPPLARTSSPLIRQDPPVVSRRESNKRVCKGKGNLFAEHTVALMRDGYIEPDLVIQLAQMVKAEKEASHTVSEMVDSETNIQITPRIHTRVVLGDSSRGSPVREGRSESQSADERAATDSVPGCTDAAIRDAPESSVPESPQPMEGVERASNGHTGDGHASIHSDGVDSDSRVPQGHLVSDPILRRDAPELSVPESPQPMEGVEDASNDHIGASIHSDGVDSDSRDPRGQLVSDPTSRDSVEGSTGISPPNSLQRRNKRSSSEDPDYIPSSQEESGEDDDLESLGSEEEGSEEEEDGRDEDGEWESGVEATSNFTATTVSRDAPSVRKKKSSTDVFWDDDVDLDSFYDESTKKNEASPDLNKIAAEGIPDPGVERLAPADPNVSRPSTQEDDPPVQLDLKDLRISDVALRNKL